MTAQPGAVRNSAGRPTLVFAGTVAATMAVFRLLDIGIARLARIPSESYTQAFFLDDVALRAWRLASTRVPWWLASIAAASLLLAFAADQRIAGGEGRRRCAALFTGWPSVDGGTALRWLVVAVSAVGAWALSCYSRNQYFGPLHLADRVLVLALWVAIAWRPIFVLPFALAAAAVAGQFVIPLGFISWTEMGVVLRFPVLFGAFWIVRSLSAQRRSDAFVFAWCCLLAATYWTSGLGKLRVDWLSHPHVALLLLGAHANGWLASVETATVERLAEWVARFARPLMLVTLLVECGALVLLWRRWTLVGFLLLAAAFHLGAFALTGIFFWKWIVVDAFLLVYVVRGVRKVELPIFTPGRFALSVAAIVATPVWAPSENLTWFDTPLAYSLRFEATDTSGTSHPLPAGFFRPYTEAIVLGTFAGISPHPQLTRGMGVTDDRRLAELLVQARSAEEFFALERERGVPRTSAAAEAAFDDFVGRYAASARCAPQREPALLRAISAPRHLWTFPLDAALPCGIALASVEVFELTTWYDGRSLRLIRRRLLREIALPGRER